MRLKSSVSSKSFTGRTPASPHLHDDTLAARLDLPPLSSPGYLIRYIHSKENRHAPRRQSRQPQNKPRGPPIPARTDTKPPRLHAGPRPRRTRPGSREPLRSPPHDWPHPKAKSRARRPRAGRPITSRESSSAPRRGRASFLYAPGRGLCRSLVELRSVDGRWAVGLLWDGRLVRRWYQGPHRAAGRAWEIVVPWNEQPRGGGNLLSAGLGNCAAVSGDETRRLIMLRSVAWAVRGWLDAGLAYRRA